VVVEKDSLMSIDSDSDSLTVRTDAADRIRTRPSNVRKTENAVVKADVSEEMGQTEMLVRRITTKRL